MSIDATIIDNVFQPLVDKYVVVSNAFGWSRFMLTGTCAFLLVGMGAALYFHDNIFWTFVCSGLASFLTLILYRSSEVLEAMNGLVNPTRVLHARKRTFWLCFWVAFLLYRIWLNGAGYDLAIVFGLGFTLLSSVYFMACRLKLNLMLATETPASEVSEDGSV